MRQVFVGVLAMLAILTACNFLFIKNVTYAAEKSAVGEELYKKYRCAICHGATGNHPTRKTYPKLGGQEKAYLTNQIKDIRDGIRENGQSRLMRPLVKNLTDEEITEIAEFLARNPSQ